MRRALTIGVVMAMALAGFATGVVFATDDPKVIHGCVNNNTGRLSVVSTPDDCTKNETPLDWERRRSAVAFVTVVETFQTPPFGDAGGRWNVFVDCPEGTSIVSGGATLLTFGWTIQDSAPIAAGGGGSSEGETWRVEVVKLFSDASDTALFNVTATCVSGAPVETVFR